MSETATEKHPFEDEAIERGAKALAEAMHGGEWEKTYTALQRRVWRARVRFALMQPLAAVPGAIDCNFGGRLDG